MDGGTAGHEALNDNKSYAAVWQVLRALRSHDDCFDAMINKMDLDLSTSIFSQMEVVTVTDKVTTGSRNQGQGAPNPNDIFGNTNRPGAPKSAGAQTTFTFKTGVIERALYAKVVQKCGNRHHWEDWANDVAKIARTHIDRIDAPLANPAQVDARAAFEGSAHALRSSLNESVTDREIVEMLAQRRLRPGPQRRPPPTWPER